MLRRPLRTIVVASLLLLAAAACTSRPHARRDRFVERRMPAVAPDDQRRSLVHDGIPRSYVVRSPAGVRQGGRPLPLVFVLHGGGGNAANAERMTGFTQLVEREQVIVVYPEGTAGREGVPLRTWNAVHCCGAAMQRRVDDVGFIAALLDEMQRTLPVDPARVYATGMSNGAMMSHRLGLALSSRIAAIAPVVGAVFGDEVMPPVPVSALMINGLLDRSVPAGGGIGQGRGQRQWDGTPTRPNLDQAAFWSRANGCAPTPVRETRGAVVTTRFDCPEGRRVELQQISDNGHAWPGGERGGSRGDTPSSAMRATEVIWAFFASVSRR